MSGNRIINLQPGAVYNEHVDKQVFFQGTVNVNTSEASPRQEQYMKPVEAICAEAAEVSAEPDTAAYPEITEQNTDFFEKTFWAAAEAGGAMGRKRQMDVPADWILHTIYDATQDWAPTVTASVHKWKLLYEVLRRLKYFRIETKHRYADFVRAVVRYRFPDTRADYANNISKSKLDDQIANWAAPDKELFRSLKSALTIPQAIVTVKK